VAIPLGGDVPVIPSPRTTQFSATWLGWVAERESALGSARVRAGQARYVAQGGKLGRAKGAKDETKRKVANYYQRYQRERENRR
jgi:DNA invertase Pin-like site-specific DNA recombinase